jgi:matrixin
MSKLPKGEYTYRILSTDDGFFVEEIEHIFQRSFDKWVTRASLPLSFRPVREGVASIVIGWEDLGIGDGEALIGLADYPNGGTQRIRLNSRLDWEDGADMNTFDIASIALHEVGHVLGLTHSDNDECVMCDCLGPGFYYGTLTDEDEHEARSLYGTLPPLVRLLRFIKRNLGLTRDESTTSEAPAKEVSCRSSRRSHNLPDGRGS